MRKDRRTKRTTVIAAAVVMLTVGGIAAAYWTAGGSGSGSAATGSTAPVTVNQTSTVSNLRPGGPAQLLDGDFDNDNDGPIYVTSVVASIASVQKAAGAPAGDCDASDYTLAGATMPVGVEVTEGVGVGGWSGATLAFKNKADVNQNACKGATVNLAYTAN